MTVTLNFYHLLPQNQKPTPKSHCPISALVLTRGIRPCFTDTPFVMCLLCGSFVPQSSELYVTGKRWNKMYKLRGVQKIVQEPYRVKQWDGKFGPPPSPDWVPPDGRAK